MNIWIIHHYANAPDAPGDARHFSHARELIRRGHQVRIVVCSFHHLTHEEMLANSRNRWESREYDGVPFTWIRTRNYKEGAAARIVNMIEFSLHVVWCKWASGLDRPDIVMGSSPHPFAALAAERLAAHYKVPFVLEVRDAWPYVLTEVGGHSRFHPFVQLVDWTMRYLYSRAARIVMFSKHSAQLLTGYGADPRKIVWIPHGVDLAMSPEPRLAPEDGVFTVTYIGAHNQWNSLDTLLDAAKLLLGAETKHVVIRLVGDGGLKQALVTRAHEENIGNVRFDGPVPKSAIHTVLHESDAFILNNRVDDASRNWMSFNKLYEYMAAGRPVIFGSCASDNPVEDAGAGLSTEADDPLALADAIRFMAGRSPQELARFGELGRRYIKEHYSIQMLAGRFESLLLEATGSSKSSGTANEVPAHA